MEFLESHKKKIKILNPNSNVYKEVNNCDLLIAIPFTSAVQVAQELNVPNLYFVQKAEGWDLSKADTKTPLITTKSNLYSFIVDTFNLKA